VSAAGCGMSAIAASPGQPHPTRGSSGSSVRHFLFILRIRSRPYGLSWLDLAGRWLRLDRLAATAVARLLSPAGCAGIPRAPNKSAPRRPPRRSGSKPSAASIAPGPSIAIEAAMVAGSKQRSEENYHGEHRLFQEGQCRVRSRRAKCPLCQVIVIDVGQS